jgi:UDP-N-acetylmuramyl pentapeptide phosphotransferase/UDP-N-acetylglucosamine-1-phosphate transferase
MGGMFILAAMGLAVALWGDFSNRYVPLALFLTFALGAVGAWDDWVKLSTRKNGLSVRQKFAAQWVICGVGAAALYVIHHDKPGGVDLYVPILRWSIPLGLLFIAWAATVLVGASNAVNLTDGLDGLAAGAMAFAGSAFVALTYFAGHKTIADYLRIPSLPGCGELTVVLGAMVGAVLGFLWFNAHPAQVFMGDTGSLPLGGLIGLAACATRLEHLLVRLPPGPHRVLDDRLATRIAVLRLEPLEDPLRRMPLLPRSLLVGFEDLMNDRQHRRQDPPRSNLALPIPRRLRMRQDLLQRVPAQLVLQAGGTLAQAVYQHGLANRFPNLHVTSHVLGTSRKPIGWGCRPIFRLPQTARMCAAIFIRVFPRSAPPFSTGLNTRIATVTCR